MQLHPAPPQTAPEPLQANIMIEPVPKMEPVSRAVEAEPARIKHRAAGSSTHSAKHQPMLSEPTPPNKQDEPPVLVADPITPPSTSGKPLASMAAPPPPSAEEWALAATYTLKNSKRYRHNWAQQVRSMMGTAVEGVEAGLVRLRVKIAPDGKLASVDVLWSTSEVAEKLALQAIRSLPPLPPTPTGEPLVFDKTIAFVPFEIGWPPIYKYDCLPDPSAFNNPFVWNGSSPQRTPQAPQENASESRRSAPQTECPPGSVPEDSIEAEEKDMERQFKEWGAVRLNGEH
jgi:TonB family protein